MNNKDWLLHLSRENFKGVQLMLESLDIEEIVLNCSPRHTQSVLEDLRSVALEMCLKLQGKKYNE